MKTTEKVMNIGWLVAVGGWQLAVGGWWFLGAVLEGCRLSAVEFRTALSVR